jgi:hypothetical protein
VTIEKLCDAVSPLTSAAVIVALITPGVNGTPVIIPRAADNPFADGENVTAYESPPPLGSVNAAPRIDASYVNAVDTVAACALIIVLGAGEPVGVTIGES